MSLITKLVTFRPKRKIGTFTAQVTIEEQHSDELTITQHPVEQGAAITDHAYKNPARLTIRAGWSNSSAASLVNSARALANGDIGGALGSDYLRDLYKKLLDLQSKREPFEVLTGKRNYKNMLISGLAVTTDEKTENVLLVTVSMQEIIIVQTQATTVPPAGVQATPEKTAPVQSAGPKQLGSAPTANQDQIKVISDLKALRDGLAVSI